MRLRKLRQSGAEIASKLRCTTDRGFLAIDISSNSAQFSWVVAPNEGPRGHEKNSLVVRNTEVFLTASEIEQMRCGGFNRNYSSGNCE